MPVAPPGAARKTRAPSGPRAAARLAAILLAALAPAAPASALVQASPYSIPAAEIERRLATEPFQITGMVDNRWDGDRTQRTALKFRDGTVLGVKWARAAEGGFALNNQPRYELAAYRLQDLFLDAEDRVVPPTVLRVMPLRVYRQLEPELAPTFEGTESVLVLLQYWLDGMTALVAPDSARFDDDVYARRLGNLNILTHLIRHADSNHGNLLISKAGDPRMFAVDNGVAFGSPDSPRGTLWKDLHIGRLPAAAVDRLRRVDRATLERTLANVAQLRLADDDGRLELTEPTPRRSPNRGIEFADGIVQMGLTDREIDAVWTRLQQLLARVDRGEIETF